MIYTKSSLFLILRVLELFYRSVSALLSEIQTFKQLYLEQKQQQHLVTLYKNVLKPLLKN